MIHTVYLPDEQIELIIDALNSYADTKGTADNAEAIQAIKLANFLTLTLRESFLSTPEATE